MPAYQPPLDDIRFLLRDVFDVDRLLPHLFATPDVDADFLLAVLEEAGHFCCDILQPLNSTGDRQGCRLQDGGVITPQGFPEAYRAFADGGWTALSCPAEFGGQGLPRVLQLLCDEMVSACNLSFGLFPGLTRGAVEAIAAHANEELKSTFLPHLVSGRWTGVMALTEASAGTDLGLLKTQARPNGDGSYVLTGSKIFISSGDHDFGGNIVHLVLARLPDAPAGAKGISLFLAPKFLPSRDGADAEPNNIRVGAIEHKMGIHAQPTCVMNYDGAKSWLVGEPHRGLQCMFTMMNAERLFVGIQGLGVASAAYQMAAAYAKERLQGRSADGSQATVPIIEHPDVRRMLLTIRSFVEAGRALAVWMALQMDSAAHHPDAAARSAAQGMVVLLTPVIKAAFSDMGFESAVLAQQVFGGHGYVHEWGVEQLVRDARITQIYEGTNGVQALDLVTRKLFLEDGQLPNRFFALVEGDLAMSVAAEGNRSIAGSVTQALNHLRAVTGHLQACAANPADLGAASSDYLRLFALVALGWMWVRMTSPAERASAQDPALDSKQTIARFFAEKTLPQSLGLAQSIIAGSASLMELPAVAF